MPITRSFTKSASDRAKRYIQRSYMHELQARAWSAASQRSIDTKRSADTEYYNHTNGTWSRKIKIETAVESEAERRPRESVPTHHQFRRPKTARMSTAGVDLQALEATLKRRRLDRLQRFCQSHGHAEGTSGDSQGCIISSPGSDDSQGTSHSVESNASTMSPGLETLLPKLETTIPRLEYPPLEPEHEDQDSDSSYSYLSWEDRVKRIFGSDTE